jgi:hypothetical protein
MGNHTRITVQTDAGTLVSLRFHESDERASVEEGLVDREVHVWWDPRVSALVALGDEPDQGEVTGGGPTE